MIRNLLTLSLLAVVTATAASAQSHDGYFNPPNSRGGPLDLGPTRYTYQQPAGSSGRVAEQLLRWGAVGKCVAAKDREASLSYIGSRRGSVEAAAAAERLRPVFTSCLTGSGVIAASNEAYRRAAVADALGVRLSS